REKDFRYREGGNCLQGWRRLRLPEAVRFGEREIRGVLISSSHQQIWTIGSLDRLARSRVSDILLYPYATNEHHEGVPAYEKAGVSQALFRRNGHPGPRTAIDLGFSGETKKLGRQFRIQHRESLFCQVGRTGP